MDKRKQKRLLIKDFISKGWTKGKATQQITNLIKEESDRHKYFNKFIEFLTKENIQTIKIKSVNSKNEEGYLAFSLLSKEPVNPESDCDITLSDKPVESEIDFNKLEISHFHMIAAFNSMQFEEEHANNPKYMVRMLYTCFMYCIQEKKFKLLDNLKKEYKRIK